MDIDKTLENIRYQRGSLSILDQLKLPDEIVYISISTVDDAWKAIHTMSIRGAPAIAVCGALSVAVDLYNSRLKFDSIASVQQFVTDQLNYLITARSTTVNLKYAARNIINYLMPLYDKHNDISLYIDELIHFIEQILQCDIHNNRLIGQYGADLISQLISNQKKVNILTHSNTGSLATAGFGTALGIIRQLEANNILQLVYFTETRPGNQGSRLTAYEVIHDRIPHTMVGDSMAGLLMRTEIIHVVIVGADCIAVNGDTANKIGTYQLAILAKYHGIPFYVAAPTSSIDVMKRTGDEIVIEMHPASEMTTIRGTNVTVKGVRVWNPSFDITPGHLITGIITECGVYKPNELEEQLVCLKRPTENIDFKMQQ